MLNKKVLWFTGLSGSGKTTIANLVYDALINKGRKVMIIDGDVIRNTIHKDLKFTPEDIKENNRLIALMCKKNIIRNDYILVPIISPFRENRDYARQLLAPQFAEVYVRAALDECKRRDVKGLYKRALSGEIKNFIGISPNTPYEEPVRPEVVLDTSNKDANSCASDLMDYLKL